MSSKNNGVVTFAGKSWTRDGLFEIGGRIVARGSVDYGTDEHTAFVALAESGLEPQGIEETAIMLRAKTYRQGAYGNGPIGERTPVYAKGNPFAAKIPEAEQRLAAAAAELEGRKAAARRDVTGPYTWIRPDHLWLAAEESWAVANAGLMELKNAARRWEVENTWK